MSLATIAAPIADDRNDSWIDADLLYESIDGREVAKPILGALEHVVMSVLAIELGHHAKQHDLGRVVAEGLFRIHPTGRRMRMPDVAFVSKERWGRDRKVTSANGIDVVPDLAVEVVSPTDHPSLSWRRFASIRRRGSSRSG